MINLDQACLASIFYHDLFDFPLTSLELIKWRGGKYFPKIKKTFEIEVKDGFYFLKGKEKNVPLRIIKKRIARRKNKIAFKAASLLNDVPWIKFVGITGTLAMENAERGADIDLLIITNKGTLWLSRILSFISLSLLGIPLRRAGEKEVEDKICLNMWLEEGNFTWSKKERNVYTAHEICQIVPLINKEKIYQEFLFKNNWIKNFWPNAVRIKKVKLAKRNKINFPILFLNKIAFRIQYLYMKSKITKEKISLTKAIFHPFDWGEVINSKLRAS
jgi:hypothetical protein